MGGVNYQGYYYSYQFVVYNVLLILMLFSHGPVPRPPKFKLRLHYSAQYTAIETVFNMTVHVC